MTLDGSVAVVTGGARGIGAAVGARLAADGALVVVTDVLEAEGTATAAALGRGSRFLALDVTDEHRWQEVIAQVETEHGAVDILVNNAGIMAYAPIESTDVATFRRLVDVDLTGTFLGMRAVIPGMRARRRGAIVNISSTCGLQGSAFLGAYVASKWGVRGLTKSAAIELARSGVRVNSVHPGGIDTAMVRGPSSTDEDVAALGVNIPLGRLGQPEDVAGVVAFLVSADAAFCTGSEFTVDGGYTSGDHWLLSWSEANRVGEP